MDALFIRKLFKLHVIALPGLLSTPSSLPPHPLKPIPSVSALGFRALWTLCALSPEKPTAPHRKGAESLLCFFALQDFIQHCHQKVSLDIFLPDGRSIKSHLTSDTAERVLEVNSLSSSPRPEFRNHSV